MDRATLILVAGACREGRVSLGPPPGDCQPVKREVGAGEEDADVVVQRPCRSVHIRDAARIGCVVAINIAGDGDDPAAVDSYVLRDQDLAKGAIQPDGRVGAKVKVDRIPSGGDA